MTSSAANAIPKPQNCSIIVVKAGHPQPPGPGSSSSDQDRTHKRQIYVAAASGSWSEDSSSCFKTNPDWFRIPLSARGITALHVAVSMEQTSFVEKLVDCMNMQDMEIAMEDRNTAFCLAAISGNVKIAEILFGKNPRLLWIKGQNDLLPIQLASSAGHIPMTKYLFYKTVKDLHNISFEDIVKLFFSTISNNIYSVASKLLDRYPKLVTRENEGGLTPLQILAQFSLCKENFGHQDIVSSLFKGIEKESLSTEQLSKAMFDAAKSGNIMVLEFLFKYHPDLLFEVDSREQRSLLHIAILFRQETVYRLILRMGSSKNVMVQLVDFEGNNVLHLAGMSAPKERFGLPAIPILICSEEIWFQEVEKIVPPAMKRMRNKEGLTPKELFCQSHRKMHEESVSGVNVLANTLIVVAVLIITLGITGAITVPIRDLDSKLTPFFVRKTWYTLFFLSIAFGTFFCAASMFFYASVVLPSSLKPRDESASLRLTKMIFGSVSLFVSIGVMFTAAISGSILIFDFLSFWGLYFICGLGGTALVLHLTLDYILWWHVALSVLSFCRVDLENQPRLLWPFRKICEAYINHWQQK